MSSILIRHHPGLGDHLMCHGIVREYAKRYDRVGLFSLPQNYPSVSFMYRDLKNLEVIKASEAETEKIIAPLEAPLLTGRAEKDAGGSTLGYNELKIIGFQYLDRTSGEPLERQYYRMAGVPLEKKWSSFFVERDRERERALFEKIVPDKLPGEGIPSRAPWPDPRQAGGDSRSGSFEGKKEKYLFLHEDAERNYRIERKLISSKYKIVEPKPELTENIFDYCAIIEKAEEIHVIDSSFMFLVDCLKYENPRQKLFIHRYARENEPWKLPILKKNWRILTLEPSQKAPSGRIGNFLDTSETLLLTHPLSRRVARKLYRTLGWRTRTQKRGS